MKVQAFYRCMLTLWILCCFCVHGDVSRIDAEEAWEKPKSGTVLVSLDEKTYMDPNERQFVELIKSGRIETLIQDKLPKDKGWQMFGCAVLVPNGEDITTCPVYAGKKCKNNDQSTDEINNKNYFHLLYYRSDMHTERQVITVASEDTYLRSVAINGTIVPWKDSDVDLNWSNLCNLAGDLYVYTKSVPCNSAKKDNKNLSCVEYYKLLVKSFQNLRIHIYAEESDGYFSERDRTATQNVVDHIHEDVNWKQEDDNLCIYEDATPPIARYPNFGEKTNKVSIHKYKNNNVWKDCFVKYNIPSKNYDGWLYTASGSINSKWKYLDSPVKLCNKILANKSIPSEAKLSILRSLFGFDEKKITFHLLSLDKSQSLGTSENQSSNTNQENDDDMQD